MNEKIAFSAMAILLAASMLAQTRSPQFAALAGTYVAVSADGGARYVLTLAADGTAEFRSMTYDRGLDVAPETGAWMLDGAAVQVALSRGVENAHAVTLAVNDGTLVVAGADATDPSSRLSGLTFRR